MQRREFLALIPATAVAAERPVPMRGTTARPFADWPQWHGPDRNNLSADTGLLKTWSAGGPKLVWKTSGLGAGYGSIAIKGDQVYVQGTKLGQSAVYCVQRADGRLLWNAPIGKMLDQDRGDGPRSTPTLEGDRLYVLTENGDLACIDPKSSNGVWHRNILADFRAENPHWLLSESPLVDGERLIVSPGGSGAGIVAYDKATGKNILWKSTELSDPAGYASCIVADIAGVRTVMTLTSRAGVGVRATDGKLLWRYEPVANRTANCTTPIYSDNKVFYTSAYGTGCALLDLKPQNGVIKATEVYFSREMMNHHGGVVLVNGHLYGFSNAILTCMDFQTGQVKWRDRSVGKGSLTYADGMLFLFGEGNTVGLAEATPDGYREKGRFTIEDQGRPSWAHPVVCGGRLYIRNQGTLACYDVKA